MPWMDAMPCDSDMASTCDSDILGGDSDIVGGDSNILGGITMLNRVWNRDLAGVR